MNCQNNKKNDSDRSLPWFLLIVVVGLINGSSGYTDNGKTENSTIIGNDNTGNGTLYCPVLKRQPALDLKQIMGKWYAVEVVKHKIEPPAPDGRKDDAQHVTTTVKTCPVVELWPDDNQNSKGNKSEDKSSGIRIRLLWVEDAGDLEYSFSVPDLGKNPGLWRSEGPQNGTLLTHKYVQFAGSVQVIKATGSRMVLTFCSTPSPAGAEETRQLFSFILSREHRLQESFAIGVQNLLARHGLTVESVKETCVNVPANDYSNADL
ncbi:uncharacterized protein LOC124305401 [Neodiprion virginianus]|uniref:uncharacterized protein LOC124305401 n=1 Tax=Neodiprion virginianus TaxID=2961670 RepID=UPI001EE70A05|nr:uncharacterized protein LOC124305401 [Neodiprion virginianus]XP_046620747.1 uncharacterized protein LOC124305401 [Neodiprion virginianus]